MRLLLCDGTNIVIRHASVQTDVPREQVLASAGRMVRRAAETVGATHLIVAFDAPGHSFRHALYPEYKAHRADRRLETEQWAVDGCAAFAAAGVATVFVPEFEADDVIATLATRATAAGERGHHTVHILSGDSDLLVLAEDPQVRCWQFRRKDEGEGPTVPAIIERSREWIAQKYGIASPKQLTDYKALVGEPGDNVAGVAGVGPVNARKLLREFGSIDQMNHYGILGASATWATRARDLIALRTDAPIPPISPSHCRITRRSNAA